jgi:hypothetical protein
MILETYLKELQDEGWIYKKIKVDGKFITISISSLDLKSPKYMSRVKKIISKIKSIKNNKKLNNMVKTYYEKDVRKNYVIEYDKNAKFELFCIVFEMEFENRLPISLYYRIENKEKYDNLVEIIEISTYDDLSSITVGSDVVNISVHPEDIKKIY